jgi:hypothetical protein
LIKPTRLVFRNLEGFFKTSTLDAPSFEIPAHACKLLLVETLAFADPAQ